MEQQLYKKADRHRRDAHLGGANGGTSAATAAAASIGDRMRNGISADAIGGAVRELCRDRFFSGGAGPASAISGHACGIPTCGPARGAGTRTIEMGRRQP